MGRILLRGGGVGGSEMFLGLSLGCIPCWGSVFTDGKGRLVSAGKNFAFLIIMENALVAEVTPKVGSSGIYIVEGANTIPKLSAFIQPSAPADT